MKRKMLLGALLLVTGTVWAAPTATAAAKGTDQYELKSFIADFAYFKSDDKVPSLYLTEEYTVRQWNLHSLPASTAGIHWTYMGGTYVLVNDADAKITEAYSDEIFYHW